MRRFRSSDLLFDGEGVISIYPDAVVLTCLLTSIDGAARDFANDSLARLVCG